MWKELVFLLLLKCLGLSVSFCVFDNKKGFWIDCGIRDSYLFRIKDIGGIQANFDVGIGFGDEKGFPNSISKTNHKAKAPFKHHHPPSTYLPPNSGYHRKDDGVHNRRSDFPYKFESFPPSPPGFPPPHPPRIPTIVNDNAKKAHRQPPHDKKQKQKVQYIHHQRAPQNQKYLSQNQYHQYYNQLQSNSVDPKQKKYPLVWSPQKPQAVVTRRSYQTLSQSPEYRSPTSKYSFIPPTKKFQTRTFHESSVPIYNPSGLLVPPPPMPPPYHNQHTRQDNGFFNPGFEKPFVFRVPTTTTLPPPTVGPAMSELLNVPAHLSANSDNVPSFAAKMFVVREAPFEFYPPHYNGNYNPNRPKINVQIPRTKFYCEEQKYLPGIYADSMLGCKVFHLCVPSSVGSTLTSYMCPNGTLFDQSILQCNFWYNVDCESSVSDYDANLALALSYRRINAAHMPLQAATDTGTLSLLSQNIDHLQVSNPKTTLSKRVGRILSVNEVDTSLTDKNIDKKTLPISKDPKKLFIHVNRTPNNKNKVNTTLIDEFSNNSTIISNISSTETLNKTTNSSEIEESLEFSDSSLRNLVVQIQNQFKTKKANELNKSSSLNLNLNSKSDSWTPLYKDENSRFLSVNVNNLTI